MIKNQEKATRLIRITLPAISWLAIHGDACLGLRHPENNGLHRPHTWKALDEIELQLCKKGLLIWKEIEEIRKDEREYARRNFMGE